MGVRASTVDQGLGSAAVPSLPPGAAPVVQPEVLALVLFGFSVSSLGPSCDPGLFIRGGFARERRTTYARSLVLLGREEFRRGRSRWLGPKSKERSASQGWGLVGRVRDGTQITPRSHFFKVNNCGRSVARISEVLGVALVSYMWGVACVSGGRSGRSRPRHVRPLQAFQGARVSHQSPCRLRPRW